MTIFDFWNRNWSFWPLKLHKLANFRFKYPISITKIFLNSPELVLSYKVHMLWVLKWFLDFAQKNHWKILLFDISRDSSTDKLNESFRALKNFMLSDMSYQTRNFNHNCRNGPKFKILIFWRIPWPSYSFLWKLMVQVAGHWCLYKAKMIIYQFSCRYFERS